MTPDTYTIEEKLLNVGDGHQLYTQLWGNKDAAETIIFLHGGPGTGCKDSYKTIFDPTRQRVIFFDQRGCGKSLPYGSLEANDTDALVEDISRIADSFGVEQFTLTGGSWGSCLALVYAIRRPERVQRMVLRGIFTGRKSEIDFLETGRFRAFFPDVWQAFVASVPPKAQTDPAGYHRVRMLGNDPEAAKASAYAYGQLESAVLHLDDRLDAIDFETFDPVGSIIEVHYMQHGCFLPEGYIMEQAAVLKMPVVLIQGRYDMICPPFTAYELSQKLPSCQLHWTVAGHSGSDRANYDVTKVLLA